MRLPLVFTTMALAGCGAGAVAEVGVQSGSSGPAVSCRDGGRGTGSVKARDVTLGPLTVLFARRTVGHTPDGFNGHGWKLPVTLRAGNTATLSVPARLHRRVGLVFTRATQTRVWRHGVRRADREVSFTACAGDDAPARTGWPGGIVVDRPRCATLLVRLPDATEPIKRDVPLGKRCRARPPAA